MTVIAVGSVHGSPGASTLAVDLAQMCGSDSLLVEADPDGGCLAARLDLSMKPGLTELAGAARVGIAAADLWRFAQPTDLGVAVIVAHPSAEQVHAALRTAVHHVGAAIRAIACHVVIDVGRLRPGSPSLGLAGLADRTIVMAGNDVASVVSLHHRAGLLRNVANPSVVLATAKPYSVDDVAAASGLDVWGVVSAGGRRSAQRRRTAALHRLAHTCIGDAAAEVAAPLLEALGVDG